MERKEWDLTTAIDGTNQRDSTTAYEGLNDGHIFWADWLGEPQTIFVLEWISPKLDWMATDYYSFDDLNRVENNIEVVAELVSYFVALPPFVYVVDRNEAHVEFADSLNRIEGFQNVLRQRLTPTGWIANKLDWLPNDPFSFSDAIRLEKNLNALYRHYKGNADYIARCGAVTCGEGMV